MDDADVKKQLEAILKQLFDEQAKKASKTFGLGAPSPAPQTSGKILNVDKDGKTSVFIWIVPSSRSHAGQIVNHEVLLHEDGSLSCNCQGWIFQRKDKKTGLPKPRTCKHVKAAEAEAATVYKAWQKGEALQKIDVGPPQEVKAEKKHNFKTTLVDVKLKQPTIEEAKKQLNNGSSSIRYGRVLDLD